MGDRRVRSAIRIHRVTPVAGIERRRPVIPPGEVTHVAADLDVVDLKIRIGLRLECEERLELRLGVDDLNIGVSKDAVLVSDKPAV